MKTKRSDTRSTIYKAVLIIAVFAIFVGIIFLVCNFFCLKYEYAQTQNKLSQVEDELQKIVLDKADGKIQTASEFENEKYEAIISYLESETTKHREFIETQRQYLIWLVAAIGAIAITALGFVGFTNRKDIEETVNKTVDEFADDALADNFVKVINNAEMHDKRFVYLKNAIEAQEQVYNTNLYLFYQDEKTGHRGLFEDVERYYDEKCKNVVCCEYSQQIKKKIEKLIDEGKKVVIAYDVKKEEYNKEDKKIDCSKFCKAYDAVEDVKDKENQAYAAKPNESSNSDAAKKEYEMIKKLCKDKKIYCVLYVEGRINKDTNEYCATANMPITLYQHLESLMLREKA